jgi:drug/metabolite transporter (DMT)-like permease
VRELISIVSFVMAVIGGLAVMFVKDRDKQTTSSIVAGVFLISFFINVGKETKLVLQIACMVAFAMAVLGGIVTIFSDEEHRRTGAVVTGIVALGTSLVILFTYLEFRLF